MHLQMMKAGAPVPVHADEPSLYTPIHERDIIAMIPDLLEAPSIPANIVNWCGQQDVSIEEWCRYMGELTGTPPEFNRSDQTLESVRTDGKKLRGLARPPQVDWRDGLREMIETRHPEWLAEGGG